MSSATRQLLPESETLVPRRLRFRGKPPVDTYVWKEGIASVAANAFALAAATISRPTADSSSDEAGPSSSQPAGQSAGGRVPGGSGTRSAASQGTSGTRSQGHKSSGSRPTTSDAADLGAVLAGLGASKTTTACAVAESQMAEPQVQTALQGYDSHCTSSTCASSAASRPHPAQGKTPKTEEVLDGKGLPSLIALSIAVVMCCSRQ